MVKAKENKPTVNHIVEQAANALKAKRFNEMEAEMEAAKAESTELKHILFEQTKEIKQHQETIKCLEGLINKLRNDIDKKDKAICVFIDSLEND